MFHPSDHDAALSRGGVPPAAGLHPRAFRDLLRGQPARLAALAPGGPAGQPGPGLLRGVLPVPPLRPAARGGAASGWSATSPTTRPTSTARRRSSRCSPSTCCGRSRSARRADGSRARAHPLRGVLQRRGGAHDRHDRVRQRPVLLELGRADHGPGRGPGGAGEGAPRHVLPQLLPLAQPGRWLERHFVRQGAGVRGQGAGPAPGTVPAWQHRGPRQLRGARRPRRHLLPERADLFLGRDDPEGGAPLPRGPGPRAASCSSATRNRSRASPTCSCPIRFQGAMVYQKPAAAAPARPAVPRPRAPPERTAGDPRGRGGRLALRAPGPHAHAPRGGRHRGGGHRRGRPGRRGEGAARCGRTW